MLSPQMAVPTGLCGLQKKICQVGNAATRLIQEVRIAPDGTGRMNLNPIPQRSGEVPELNTKDYGRHWRSN
jgi:hypothetical protein